jgi:hypothetical protein
MSEHTKLPWKRSRRSRYISDVNNRVIAEVAPLHAFEANAAFIVKARRGEDLPSALCDFLAKNLIMGTA